MTGNQGNENSYSQGSASTQEPESLADLLTLPPEQRQLLIWMIRQGSVSFAQLELQLGTSADETRGIIADLLQQGLITVVGSDLYRAYSPIRRQQQYADAVLQSLTTRKPLAVILNSSGRDVITPGSFFELGITVSNQGDQSAVVNVFLEDLPPAMRPWASSTQEYLALAPNQSGEVFFRFRIPVEAMPGLFSYLLVIDAPQHYPEFPPARYTQQLQVLPPVQDTVQASDPTFVLDPPTRSSRPALVQPGGILQVQVQVQNRSERVDRFRLACTDLPETWFRITYPKDLSGFGLILDADSLGLNPGDVGTILLAFQPPIDALAGNYVPTLRLYSENNPDLVLLDLIYLQVEPVYQLIPELRTIVSSIRQQAALFQVRLDNQGNTDRLLNLRVLSTDEPGLCEYKLETDTVAIAPKEVTYVNLQGRPQNWWKRPLFGPGRILSFRVQVEDSQQLPLNNGILQSYITWLARPWWQLLLVALTALGVIAALIWLIWWLFLRPPIIPSVGEFFAEDPRYAAANGDIARVGLQIENYQKVRSLRITGYSTEGEVISGPVIYDLSGKTLPAALAPFCTEDGILLSCRNVRTDARKPGTYVFELTVVPRRRRLKAEPIVAKTDPVAIDPIPLPAVAELAPSQTQYIEAGALPAGLKLPVPQLTNKGIQLNWVVSTPGQLQALLLVARNKDGTILGGRRYEFRNPETQELVIPKELEALCQLGNILVCREVATGIGAVGEFTFELTALPMGEIPEDLEPKVSDPVKVEALPAQIISFSINGQEIQQAKYLFPVDQNQPIPVLTIAWQVRGGSTTTVQLLPSPGSVGSQGSFPFPLSPEPGTVVLTLQASNGSGEPITRAVTIQTFDPTPSDPAKAAADAAAAAAAAAGQDAGDAGDAGSDGGGEPGLDNPAPVEPGRLSPSETPPKFD